MFRIEPGDDMFYITVQNKKEIYAKCEHQKISQKISKMGS